MSTYAVAAIQESEPQSLSASADTGLWCGPETILLVEDEAFVRQATAEALESAGYRLLIAKSAAEALEACRNCFRPVDLLLTDIVMPGMSGPDLATAFASLCPRARVLLMSGYADQLVGRGLPAYSTRCLAKPFSIEELLRRVREVLNNDSA